MTRHFLVLIIAFTLNAAFALDAEEEAFILNQEMQFLEDSVSATQVTTLEGSKLPQKSNSLERIYFGDEKDSISSKTAAPKRKARGL